MSTGQQTAEVDDVKLIQFVFRAVDEVGATLNTALVVMGDKLGLYRALAGTGPLSPADLAERTGIAERYVREWLSAQAAGGYVEYDPDSGRYMLPPEQTVALTDPDSPAYLPGFFRSPWARCSTRRRSSRRPAAAMGSVGTSTATTCTMAASGSSGRSRRHAGARRPARRGSRRRRGSRLHPLPTRGRDAVQPRIRSTALTTTANTMTAPARPSSQATDLRAAPPNRGATITNQPKEERKCRSSTSS